ncbi:MAG: CHAT domain-containing protein [Microcystaceae cyanobacterium]
MPHSKRIRQPLFLIVICGLIATIGNGLEIPAIAQFAPSKGTAGFSSGASNTTTSNTVYSMPSLGNNTSQRLSPPLLSLEEQLQTLDQGTPPQKALRNTIRATPNFLVFEQNNNQAFQGYLGLPNSPTISVAETQSFLSQLAKTRKIEPAIVYVFFSNAPKQTSENSPADSTTLQKQLQLLVITKDGALPIIPVEVSFLEINKTLRQLERTLSGNVRSDNYLAPSAQLYQWIIAPLQAQLQKQNINNLTFVLGEGLRTLPLAALYNPERDRFLVEDYSLGLMPSLSLIDLTIKPRVPIGNTKVLAMGADTFTDQNPLPAVPIELSEITENKRKGDIFLNKDFTVNNLKQGIESKEFSIIHLATHGVFQKGDRQNSYIYFGDQKLNLEQFSQLGLDSPKVDLLVLSACKTAFGDPNAELGFAGLAIKTGVRTALGSLWNVSDEGTLALMSLFYNNLQTDQSKAESLRQAQIAILKGNYQVVDNQLILDNNVALNLTPELVKIFKENDLRNPYYWSAFTLIGNPW